MLTSMRLTNFKSWQESGNIQLAPLTGFFGTNSSGKTSLLQAILLLKQTAESNDRNIALRTSRARDGIIDLGTIEDITHYKRDSVTISLSFFGSGLLHKSWKIPSLLRRQSSETKIKQSINFAATVTASGRVSSFEYSVAQTLKVGMRRNPVDVDSSINYEVSLSVDDDANLSQAFTLPIAPIKCYIFPIEATQLYILQRSVKETADLLTQRAKSSTVQREPNILDQANNLSQTFSDFPNLLEQQMQRTYYLGPLREYPQRTYVWGQERPEDVGSRGEYAIAALLAASDKPIYADSPITIIERIAQWLKEMGLIHSFRLNRIVEGGTLYEVRVKRTAESKEVLITEMGFGLSQILPVLVMCYYIPEGSTLILEQPEIHLHPSVQADLADVFADVIEKRKIQIILESHSEHLLRRLQRLMAEKKLASDQTALYFCTIQEGASKLGTLNMDEFGNISNWPKDFFGNPTRDLLVVARKTLESEIAEG